MPKKISKEWEGRILAVSGLNYSSSYIRKQLLGEKIIIGRQTINNIVNCVRKRHRAMTGGKKSPTKKQPLKPSNWNATRKIDLLTRKETPPSQRDMAKIVGIPRTSVQGIIKRLGKK